MTTAEQSAIYAMRIMDQDKEIRRLKAENARLKDELEAERACQDCREYRQMMEARLKAKLEKVHLACADYQVRCPDRELRELLQRELGTYNAENPQLGVSAAVELLKLDRELQKLDRDDFAKRAALAEAKLAAAEEENARLRAEIGEAGSPPPLGSWRQRAEAAEARLARIVELHKGVICCGPKCKAQDHEICCQHCSGPDCAPWPCPTVAAAKGER